MSMQHKMVDRQDVLDGEFRAFKRKAFKPERQLNVRFSGEDGVNNGGLTREFLQLAMKALSQLSIFTGGRADRGYNLSLDYKG